MYTFLIFICLIFLCILGYFEWQDQRRSAQQLLLNLLTISEDLEQVIYKVTKITGKQLTFDSTHHRLLSDPKNIYAQTWRFPILLDAALSTEDYRYVVKVIQTTFNKTGFSLLNWSNQPTLKCQFGFNGVRRIDSLYYIDLRLHFYYRDGDELNEVFS